MASALLDLKAELLKKSEEIKKEKLQKTSVVKEQRKQHKKTSIFSKKNVGVLERAQKDLEAKREEDDVISQSRKKLEAKSRLYEKMAGNNKVTEHDGSSGFLVDFEQKSIRNISEKREEERIKREEKEKEEDEKLLKESVPEPEDPDEQWVDYVDSFGRSRRCLRKDLPELQKMDVNVQDKRDASTSGVGAGTDDRPELTSAAAYREKIRQKWEEEEKKNMADPDGPLHYANVQYNEIRTHGVGYYQFEKDHVTREEQLSALKELREQTKELREKKEQFKQKRKAILKARLAKVRQRKLVREGKEAAGLDEDSTSSSDEEHIIGPKLGEAEKGEGRQSPELLTRDESVRKDAPVRDWDIGKKNDTFDEEKWLNSRREERVDEFAPPEFYYDNKSAKRKDQKGPNSDFAPPRSYSVKHNLKQNVGPDVKPKDPMAFLEYAAENESETVGKTHVRNQSRGIEANILAGISKIRTEVEADSSKNRLTEAKYSDVHSGTSEPHPGSSDVSFPISQGSGSDMQELMQSDVPRELLMMPPPPPPPPPALQVQTNMWQTPESLQSAGRAGLDAAMTSAGGVYMNVNQIRNDASVSSSQVNENVCQGISEQNQPVPHTAESTQSKTAGKVHFSSAPVKYDRFTAPVKKPRYERVNLYEVPESLPAPPTVSNVPSYPSQEEVFGSKETSKEKQEADMKRLWYRQFQERESGLGMSNVPPKAKLGEDKKTSAVIERVKPENIPFVSPYVQKRDAEDSSEKELDFDPSKPPPGLTT